MSDTPVELLGDENDENAAQLKDVQKETAIPFSNKDEVKADQFLIKAKKCVQSVYNGQILDNLEVETPLIELDEIYIVWFSKVLQNWKALVSTSRPDGRYYEVTHDGFRKRTYVDEYAKRTNTTITDH